MKRCLLQLSLIIISFLFLSCKTLFPSTASTDLIKIEKHSISDSSLVVFYQPYKDSLDKIMKVKIAELDEDLYKKQPGSTLGNLMADILFSETSNVAKTNIDFAVMNYGGIRVNTLSKGNLLIEHAYLLSPFDNYLVVQKLTGAQVQSVCDSLALKGGWPISEMTFEIKNKKAQSIKINQQPLDLSKTYSMATIDYIANGGDGMAILKSIPQLNTGVLFRDALITYWKKQTQQGKRIEAQLENRITYVE